MFISEKDGFYNETVRELVELKTKKLDKFGLTDLKIFHKIRSNGNHKVKIVHKDLVVSEEHYNFETALIEAIKGIERVYHKKVDKHIACKRKEKECEVCKL